MQGFTVHLFPVKHSLIILRAGSSVLLKDEQSSNLVKGNNFGIRPSTDNFWLKSNNLNKNYMVVEAELPI